MSLVDRGKLSIARLESKLSISRPKQSVSKVSTSSRANDLWNWSSPVLLIDFYVWMNLLFKIINVGYNWKIFCYVR